MAGVDLFSAIAEYGVLIVIAGIFIYMFNKQTAMVMSKFDKMFEYLLTGNNKKEVIEKHEPEFVALDNESVITDFLSDLMYSVDAGRAFYVRYHNGHSDALGHSLLRMSMTNESVRMGVTPTMSMFINQFRSSFAWALTTLEKNESLYIDDISSVENDDYGFYIFLKNRGVHSCFLSTIKSVDGRSVGFIGIEYTKQNATFGLDKLTDKMSEARIKLETILSIKKGE